MRNAILGMHRWSTAAARVMFWFSCALGGALAIFISISVLTRYGFGNPIALFFELAEYSLLWMTICALPYLTAHDAHIRVELASVVGGRRMFRFTEALSAVVSSASALLLLVGGVAYVRWALATGATMPSAHRPPRALIFSVIVIGSAVMFVERVSGLLAGRLREPTDEEPAALDDQGFV